jgi:diguanylate cyclase (GGDEF)-like protein
MAEIEWSRYQRYQRPMSMLMVDIDQFKSVNDSFGHHVGDHVIVQMGRICREQKRRSDVAARFGGDEFLILLPETNLAHAQRTAERLWQQVAAGDFSTSAHSFKVTVSIGVAEAEPKMDTVFDLIKLADQALYKAKNSGRNRVCAS